MARYTEKTEADLAWDRIRRTVQYIINLRAASWRIEKLNEVLPRLQDEFEAALSEGKLLELEPGSLDWMRAAIDTGPDA